jgi:hypothetical protein
MKIAGGYFTVVGGRSPEKRKERRRRILIQLIKIFISS